MNDTLKKLLDITRKPRMQISDILNRGPLDLINDAAYLKFMWLLRNGKKLDLQHPKTFNEKIQWLKLHDHNPLYAVMADKYRAKKYAADIIGEEYIVKNYGVWEHFDDIDFSALPKSFVLKTNHDNAGYVIVNDKDHFDKDSAKKFLEKHLRSKFYKRWREWVYELIPPRIIAEELLESPDGSPLPDYKLYCFNGIPKLFASYVREDSHQGAKMSFYNGTPEFTSFDIQKHHGIRTYYDENYNIIPFAVYPEPALVDTVVKPQNLDTMIDIAKKLAKDFIFLRVDFYEVGEKVYLGELTFYPWAGMCEFSPDEYNYIIGDMMHLPIED